MMFRSPRFPSRLLTMPITHTCIRVWRSNKGVIMIDINMSDVISVIESCRWYLIALAVILVIAIITSIVCRKANIVLRGLIRK